MRRGPVLGKSLVFASDVLLVGGVMLVARVGGEGMTRTCEQCRGREAKQESGNGKQERDRLGPCEISATKRIWEHGGQVQGGNKEAKG